MRTGFTFSKSGGVVIYGYYIHNIHNHDRLYAVLQYIILKRIQ